jgi:glutamate/tyrosine decarboxylase-like PLP-dependent enzyme
MLDPQDAGAFRAFAHRVLDDALDSFARTPGAPAWRAIPDAVKTRIAEAVPQAPTPVAAVYDAYRTFVAPYENGNRHPRFVGWVHGNGTPSGVLAEMLAATLNANLGGREHSAVYVERAVIAWSAAIFGMPAETTGILTSGTSLANMIAVLAARQRALGADVRTLGLAGRSLTGYASTAVHRCVPGAFAMTGIGSDALRRIAVDAAGRMDLDGLRAAVARDRAAGLTPFLVVATAGTVDIGAIDDLAAIADFCAAEKLWMHVDGAFGALAVLSPHHRALVRGIERADSIAFDYHKWLHVPYDAGCVLIRDPELHRAAFAQAANYLATADRGTAAGEPWFADFGPELSRRFRALAIWFAFKEHGTERLGAAIAANCDQAQRLAARVAAHPDLALAAPVALNIVCLRYDDRTLDAHANDALNAEIVTALQEDGIAVPSLTRVHDRTTIRINLTNHRIDDADLAAILDAIVERGRALNRIVTHHDVFD